MPVSKKNRNLKEQVKAGERTAKEALAVMKKRKNWDQVKDSRTARWLQKRV